MIDVHHVVETASRRIPEASIEAFRARGGDLSPVIRPVPIAGPRSEQRADSQSVIPEGVDLNRLADARSDRPVIDAGVHPREGESFFAGRQQAVVPHSDPVARALFMGVENRGNYLKHLI